MTDHTDLRRLAMAATPGPWRTEISLPYGRKPRVENAEKLICDVGNAESAGEAQDEWEANAAYIAAADPQTVIGLLDTIDAQQKHIDVLEAAHDLISDWLVEGTEDLPDDTPVTIKIGLRSIILDTLGSLRATISSKEGQS